MAILGDYIREECNPLGATGAQDLRLIGVSNEHGLHASSRDTSADLARYQRIDKYWFAYNPMRVNVGSIGLADDESKTGFTSPDYTVFSCREGLDPRYLLHFLKSDYGLEAIARNCSGAVRKRLYYSGLAAIKLPIPCVDEQRALVSRIDRISQTIRFIREENSDRHELPQLKQAILQEAIQGKLTAAWRAGHPDVEPASQLLRRIHSEKARLIAAKELRPEKPLPKITSIERPFEIPTGWEWCYLDDFLNVRSGIAKGGKHYTGPTNPTPYLRVANVQRGYLVLDEIKYLDLPVSEATKYALQDGDLLVNEGGDPDKVGRCAIWRNEVEGCVHQNHIFSMRPYVASSIEVEFMPLMLNSTFCQSHFLGSYKQTTNLASINKTVLRSTPIPLPPLGEQVAIVSRVEALMLTCRALDAEIEHARNHAADLLQAVLKEAFAPASATG